MAWVSLPFFSHHPLFRHSCGVNNFAVKSPRRESRNVKENLVRTIRTKTVHIRVERELPEFVDHAVRILGWIFRPLCIEQLVLWHVAVPVVRAIEARYYQ